MKVIDIKLIRPGNHPYDPDIVEYNVISMVNGEPVIHVSGAQLPVSTAITGGTIASSTTIGEIHTACVDDATTNGWLP